jgi:hypothetical protein
MKKILMTEGYQNRRDAAIPSFVMTGYVTDLSPEYIFFFFICDDVPSVFLTTVTTYPIP